jgi:hypothetical protein
MRVEGRNIANPALSKQEKLLKSYSYKEGRETCVFISHISENKNAAIAIGEYIRKAGFDIYLDIYDENLQEGVARGDDEAITKSIEIGVENSTDILCIVSESTKRSWWVPYEIGYGKKCSSSISTILLKDVKDIPSYLKISNVIRGIKSLNEYLVFLASKEQKGLFEKSASNAPNIQPHNALNHPLHNILNWNF